MVGLHASNLGPFTTPAKCLLRYLFIRSKT
jgi:hypothetical protein